EETLRMHLINSIVHDHLKFLFSFILRLILKGKFFNGGHTIDDGERITTSNYSTRVKEWVKAYDLMIPNLDLSILWASLDIGLFGSQSGVKKSVWNKPSANGVVM
ncbi:hypothetical protein M8C21_030387, partial [Ambrosia artemisiifolia]